MSTGCAEMFIFLPRHSFSPKNGVGMPNFVHFPFLRFSEAKDKTRIDSVPIPSYKSFGIRTIPLVNLRLGVREKVDFDEFFFGHKIDPTPQAKFPKVGLLEGTLLLLLVRAIPGVVLPVPRYPLSASTMADSTKEKICMYVFCPASVTDRNVLGASKSPCYPCDSDSRLSTKGIPEMGFQGMHHHEGDVQAAAIGICSLW